MSIWRKEYTIGNILKQSIDEVISQYMKFKCITIRDLLLFNEECAKWPYLKHCGLGCRANSIFYEGNFYKRDPLMCGIYCGGLFNYFLEKLNERLKIVVK